MRRPQCCRTRRGGLQPRPRPRLLDVSENAVETLAWSFWIGLPHVNLKKDPINDRTWENSFFFYKRDLKNISRTTSERETRDSRWHRGGVASPSLGRRFCSIPVVASMPRGTVLLQNGSPAPNARSRSPPRLLSTLKYRKREPYLSVGHSPFKVLFVRAARSACF